METLEKCYTVYVTTNVVNLNYYVGVHKTSNPEDDYLGSGKRLKHAMEKHGREAFKKEVIGTFGNKLDAFALEALLVDQAAVAAPECYNLKKGGEGGWDHIVGGPSQARSDALRKLWTNPEYRANLTRQLKARMNDPNSKGVLALIKTNKRCLRKGSKAPMYGKTHTEETKTKMSKSHSGSGNSQFGTMWITDGKTSQKISKSDEIPEGWRKGRKIKE